MTSLWRLTWMEGRFFLRERQAIFWTIFLPVFMLLFFGHVFGGAGYTEFLVPGLIGMNLMSVALFAVGSVLADYRDRGVLRRLRVTPLRPAAFVASQVLSRYGITLAQTLILVACAYLVFGVAPKGSPAALFVALNSGLFCFLALGFMIASLARSRAAANGIANLVFLPGLFLGGAYFPSDLFPPLLRLVGRILPLAPFLEMFRAVYVRGAPLESVAIPLLTLGAWSAVAVAVSVLFFRFE